ncbi:uncharacterized protein DUF2512 [Bacillus oleivorans]|uniref:Uncharacterized protein DUF2512 n=1 Tax=Bacillus oleivorans TaxID=1448271 RepID=A0A285CN97_9BACI|nr:YndM family protein [Bacillus oleivorans]SNX68895.1 uncharacterized protein DUF2512 [Bacillus oleivorans]
MKHVWAILAKFVIIGVVVLSFLSIFDPPFTEILLIAIVTTLISYIVGDLGILRMGNTAASIGDFILSFATIGFLSYVMIEQTWSILAASFFASLAITAIEILFHIFMKNRVYPDRNQEPKRNIRFQDRRFATEFAEETNYTDQGKTEINEKEKR